MRHDLCIPAGPIVALALIGMLACSPSGTVDRRGDIDRGVAMYVAGDYNGAVKKLESVAASAHDDAVRREAYLYIGRAQMALGNTGAALDAFSLGVHYGDTGPCVAYLEMLKQYQEGRPQGLHILEAVTRAQLAGAAVRLFGSEGRGPEAAVDPRGPSPLEQVEARGWLPAPADGKSHADNPVTGAALYVFVARVLDDLGMPGRADEVFPGGYRAAAATSQPVSGREALAALDRVRSMQENHGR